MPRARVELIDWKGQILVWIEQKWSYEQMRTAIEHTTGVRYSQSTWTRRLQELGIHQRKLQSNTVELRVRIAYLFSALRLTDADMVDILQLDGFKLNTRTLARIRKEMGLRKSTQRENFEQVDNRLRELLRDELDSTTISGFGSGNLYTYMRSKYNVIGRNRMYRLLRELDPEGVAQRRARAHEHRGHVILPGPNEVWSLDAYCKLEHWGVQIYAAVDAYSRFVIWYYVGISGRTAVSVLGQYIKTISDQRLLPRKLRTDRGAETPMMADAHYALSNEIRPTPNGQPHEFRDVFRFGTSKQNSVIERWWRQQSFGAILQWRDCFLEYNADDNFNGDLRSDRIAFLAIYIPVLRSALDSFVTTWNQHKIRKQPKRPYLTCGIPYLLYNYPERTGGEQCGVDILDNSPTLEAIRNDLTGLDLDEYLPQETLEWCEARLLQLGFPPDIDGSEVDDDGNRIHKLAYLALRDEILLHIQQANEPHLLESIKPSHARRWSAAWRPSELVQEVFRNANEELVTVQPLDHLVDQVEPCLDDENLT